MTGRQAWSMGGLGFALVMGGLEAFGWVIAGGRGLLAVTALLVAATGAVMMAAGVGEALREEQRG